MSCTVKWQGLRGVVRFKSRVLIVELYQILKSKHLVWRWTVADSGNEWALLAEGTAVKQASARQNAVDAAERLIRKAAIS